MSVCGVRVRGRRWVSLRREIGLYLTHHKIDPERPAPSSQSPSSTVGLQAMNSGVSLSVRGPAQCAHLYPWVWTDHFRPVGSPQAASYHRAPAASRSQRLVQRTPTPPTQPSKHWGWYLARQYRTTFLETDNGADGDPPRPRTRPDTTTQWRWWRPPRPSPWVQFEWQPGQTRRSNKTF